ncbi:MAG: hypothetical protein QG608_3514 [Actinomycetota bacterium]|nr:hypothetical protein [Actinomycetota bacterium]
MPRPDQEPDQEPDQNPGEPLPPDRSPSPDIAPDRTPPSAPAEDEDPSPEGEAGDAAEPEGPVPDDGPAILPPADAADPPELPPAPRPGGPSRTAGTDVPDAQGEVDPIGEFLTPQVQVSWDLPPAEDTASDWSQGYLGEDYLGRSAPRPVPSTSTASRQAPPPVGSPRPRSQDQTSQDTVSQDTASQDASEPPDPQGPVAGSALLIVPPAAPPTADSARARLRHAVRPRATRAQLLAGVLCAVLGFALVVQVKQTQEAGLDSLRQADLVRILDNITQNSNRLDSEAQSLQDTLEELRTGSDRSSAAQVAARERLNNLGLLAGTLSAIGPGIELDIVDPQHTVAAGILLNTVQELRDAGAEAIQIEDVRVIASTSFVDTDAGITVDGTGVTAPYHVVVVGDPQTLAAALNIPGGVLEVLRSEQATGSVTQRQSLTVDAVRKPITPRFVRPVPTRSAP